MFLYFKIKPKKIFKFLLRIIAFLLSSHLLLQGLYLLAVQNNFIGASVIRTVAWFFDVDQEGNLPTFYSAGSLFICAFLLAIVAFYVKSEQKSFFTHWCLSSIIFLVAAWDEATQLHERFISSKYTSYIWSVFKVNSQDVGFGQWTIVYIPLVIALSLYFLKFFRSLPKYEKGLILISGFLFMTGAIGVELIASLIWAAGEYSRDSFAYAIVAALEEGLEKLGVATFIYALLFHISVSFGEVTLQMKVAKSKTKFKYKIDK